MIFFDRFSSSTTFSSWQPERMWALHAITCLRLKVATLPLRRSQSLAVRGPRYLLVARREDDGGSSAVQELRLFALLNKPELLGLLERRIDNRFFDFGVVAHWISRFSPLVLASSSVGSGPTAKLQIFRAICAGRSSRV